MRSFPNSLWGGRLGRSPDQIGPTHNTHTLAFWLRRLENTMYKHDRQYTYNVTLRHVRATTVAVEKQ